MRRWAFICFVVAFFLTWGVFGAQEATDSAKLTPEQWRVLGAAFALFLIGLRGVRA